MSYKSERFDFMVKVEGNELEAYLDTKGLITIGIGFNIAENVALRNAVLDKILPIFQANTDEAAELVNYRNELTNLLKNSNLNEVNRFVNPAQWTEAEKTKYPKLLVSDLLPETFSLTSTQIRDIFDNVAAPSFETKVDNFLFENLSGEALVITDNEKIALFSLAYNSPSLLGEGLGWAIENGNRAEAWFQIRYFSNGDALDGIAKRRYYESDIFGVFTNENSPTIKEAKDFYRTLWKQNPRISDYENEYGTQVTKANDHYGASVETLTTIKNIALNKLKQTYGQGVDIQKVLVGYDTGYENSVTQTKENINDVINGNENYNDLIFGERGNDTLNGNGGDDVIYGGTGEDTLNGGADNGNLYGGDDNATDILIGGSGVDTLIGGAGDDILTGGYSLDKPFSEKETDYLTGGTGDDTYVVSHNDVIYDEDGLGNVTFNGVTLSGIKTKVDENTYEDENFTYTQTDGDLYVVDKNLGEYITITSFKNKDLEIELDSSDISKVSLETTHTFKDDEYVYVRVLLDQSLQESSEVILNIFGSTYTTTIEVGDVDSVAAIRLNESWGSTLEIKITDASESLEFEEERVYDVDVISSNEREEDKYSLYMHDISNVEDELRSFLLGDYQKWDDYRTRVQEAKKQLYDIVGEQGYGDIVGTEEFVAIVASICGHIYYNTPMSDEFKQALHGLNLNYSYESARAELWLAMRDTPKYPRCAKGGREKYLKNPSMYYTYTAIQIPFFFCKDILLKKEAA